MFKPGDRVYYRPGFKLRNIKGVVYSKDLGVGVINRRDVITSRWVVKFEEGITSVWECNLILEEVYNSPLYKLLTEE